MLKTVKLVKDRKFRNFLSPGDRVVIRGRRKNRGRHWTGIVCGFKKGWGGVPEVLYIPDNPSSPAPSRATAWNVQLMERAAA
ncbi:hypothetical protein EJV44_15455 [Ancylobacter aquaticus]|nr:hypothetical protein EJV44_15455 [Ancylobacter aquaticus]